MANSVPENVAPIAAACPNPAPADEPTFHLGYRRWLDGLRGVAILLVLAFHFGLLPGGSLGVDIFFVLSGFLITSLLAEEWQRRGSISLKQFYLRRVLRLLPAFVALLLVYTVYTLLRTPPELWSSRWYALAVAACYVSNWNNLHGADMSMLGHCWSLSLEEQFYLVWPALLYVMLCKLPRKRILLIVGAGILAAATLRAGMHHQHRLFGTAKIDIMRLYAGLDTRADSLLAGCLASLLVTWNLVPRSPTFVKRITLGAPIAVGLIAFCLFWRDMGHTQCYDGLFTVVAVSVAVVIVRLLVAPAGIGAKILESAPLVGAGRISYGLYLFHVPVIECFGSTNLGWQHPGTTTVVAVLSVAAALLSFYLVERPFLRLKDRLHAAGKAVDGALPTNTQSEGQAQRQAA
jgi:peptidoglycan/LPS O-acetylase OafA/YrhL